MGLFSTLVAQPSSLETTGSKRSQSLDLPSVVQLYRSKPLRLESTALTPTYAVLSYSAVSVNQSNDEMTSADKRTNNSITPDLGVWNVCIHKRGSDALMLLPNTTAHSTFCLTVDLSNPEQVEPTLSLLQDALIRYLIVRPPAASSEPQGCNKTATTSLYDLRNVTFGLAPNDDESAAKLKGDAPNEKDRTVLFTLMICARSAAMSSRVSASPQEDEYRSKQTQALLLYHLRRYAHALNAIFCVVDDEPTDDINEQPAVVLCSQLSHLWHELAQGKELNLAAPQLDTVPPESAFHLVYTPYNHNPELIESVLLRNANYPGQWNAAKESLWKILPPSSSEPMDSSALGPEKDPSPPSGDEQWLSQLRDSVATAPSDVAKTPSKTPPKSSKKEVTADSAQKDAAVSSFFESLLK